MMEFQSKKEFLQFVQSDSHDNRVKKVIALGKQSLANEQAAALVTQLSQGDFYERMLALYSCFGSKQGALLLQMLEDPSRMIRTSSLRMLARYGTESQVFTALQKLGEKARRILSRFLVKSRHYQPIDRFVESLAAKQEWAQLGNLLPFASESVAEKYIQQAQQTTGSAFYERMARFHPKLIVMSLQQQIENHRKQTEDRNPRLLWKSNCALWSLAKSDPEGAVALIDLLRKQESLNQISFSSLLPYRPQELVKRVLESEDQIQFSVDQVAHRISQATLKQLLERGYQIFKVEKVLKKLSAKQRAELYPLLISRVKSPEGIVPVFVLRLLPSLLRQKEALFHVEHPALQTRPEQKLAYAGLLPFEETKKRIAPYLNHPEPSLRAASLAQLAQSVRFSRDKMDEMLLLLGQRKNEQDPVRLAFLTELAALPLHAFQEKHLQTLANILQAAFNASDLSANSAKQIEQLIIRLMPRFPQFSAHWLAVVVKERGTLHSFSIEHRIQDQEMAQIGPLLLPVLQAWTTREQFSSLLSVAQSLGRRTRVFPGLWSLLSRACEQSKQSYVVNSILNLFHEHQNKMLGDLIVRLLQQDASVITLYPVYHYLHRRRQDLLTPFLGQKAYSGRFSTGSVRFVPSFSEGFFRWLPQQQQQYADVLYELVKRTADLRDTPTLLWAVWALARLPALEPVYITKLIEDTRIPVRDTALRALGRLDGNQGIPLLFSVLADDRGRIAIYALRRSILEMVPTLAANMLAQVPMNKVTVAKEVLRLFGELPSVVALPPLKDFSSQTLHQDVKIALLRALWSHLESEDSWKILFEAAASQDAGMASVMIRTPSEQLSEFSQKKLVQLLGILLMNPDAKIRVDLIRRCIFLPVFDPERTLFLQILNFVASPLPEERTTAAQAIFSLFVARDIPAIKEKLTLIVKNRRVLDGMIDVYEGIFFTKKTKLLEILPTLLEVLSTDPMTLAYQIKLWILGLSSLQAMKLLEKNLSILHEDAMAMAISSFIEAANFKGAGDLKTIEETFFQHPHEKLRRLGLAVLVASAQAPRTWDEEKLKRLQHYRQDPSLLVASAAQFTLPAEEESVLQKNTLLP